MPLIEGIGDEVTLSAVVLTFVLTLVLAWWTTFVGDRPLHVHIIRPQSTRHQQRSNRIQNQRTQPEETPQVVSPADVSNRTNESSRESEHETAGNSTDAGNDEEEEEGEGFVLRQRRTGSEGSREVLQNVANIENSEADASTVGNTETSEVTEPTMRQRKRCMDSINIENLQMAKHNDHEESNSSDVHEDGYLQSNVREDRTVGAVVTEQEQVERETENGTSVLQAACETTPEMSERFASSETVQERSKAVAKTETGQERPQCETDRISSEEAGRNDAEQVESDAAQSESVDRSDIPDGHITIRLKFLSENERSVTAGLQITLGQFRR
ncbi:uncharacterized protein LOC102807995 [Saccoglossus kowalevskii]|uniref:Protein gar2-like n=1 Tax=Saccoglossus kowalevskii TaxID=10224 RepID=A0ABM0MWI5_SACKO|nr:PREDICTED: protein gar2-like [Saccoglossus kowalevskii]